jgi:hypothetical protein
MREINKIAEGLFEKIRDRYEDVSLGDENANATQNPEDARFFNFDYVVDGKNYGNITLSIIDETSLKVYFSKNISHDLSDEQRDEWYSFLKELREFAKRNLLSFEPRDITRGTLKHRDIKQVSKADGTYDKDEVVSESRLYGTSRSSYENEGPVKIIIRHSDNINPEQRGSRSRKIRAIYLENAEGERLKLPENNLRYARAMARHVSEGGQINDEFGQHITEVAQECSKLRPFKAAMVRRVFEDEETQRMVEAAFEYHGLLKDTLNKMSGRKGYQQCKEQFVATSTSYIPEEDFDVDALRERFVKRTFNERMSDALPIVYKAYNMKKTNKFAESFESWANNVAESWDEDEEGNAQQWGNEPINVDDLADLFAEELPLGVDAVNATNAISDIIQNNELEELLLHSAQANPEADARDVIIGWLEENVPAVYQELMNEIGDVDSPDQYSEGNTYGDAMGGMDGQVSEDHDEYADEDQVEAIQSAIIRRILGNIAQHGDLLRAVGPDGVMNAARDVASFHAPVEELGSSDISAMVREVYQEAGVDYPEVQEGSMDPKFYKKEAPSKKAQVKKHYDWLAQNADSDSTMYRRAFNEALEAMAPSDSASPLTHAQEEYCDACDSKECHCDELEEGRVKEVAIDLEQLSDTEFYGKYGKTKEEVKATLGEGDDHVNRDEKLKRMGAKPLGMLDKLKGIKHGFDAARKGESEDELKLYNKQFKEDIEQMRRIAGLK